MNALAMTTRSQRLEGLRKKAEEALPEPAAKIPKRYRAIFALWAMTPSPVPVTVLEGEAKQARKDSAFNLDLVRRFQAGERGVEALLLKAHLPMMMKLVMRYGKGRPHEEEDLLQEARLGLLEAFARFDMSRDDANTGYVYQTMKHYVCRYLLTQGEVVRIPIHRYQGKGHKEGDREYRYGRRNVFCFTEMSHEQEQADYHTFEESLASEEALPDEVLEEKRMSRTTRDLLSRLLSSGEGRGALSLKERRILEKRFLHDEEKPPTLAEIGKEEGVCRERIRQLEESALDKLHAIVSRGHVSSRRSRLDVWVESNADASKHQAREEDRS